MKITVVMMLISCFLSGCSSKNRPLEQAVDLRKTILDADTCSFLATISADYGDEIYSFQMECVADRAEELQFTVIEPESISGITGEIGNGSAALTFDETVLAFPTLTEGMLTPVSAPWLFMHSLKGGYLTGCSTEQEGICMYIDDSYQKNALQLQIYTDANTVPIRVEIFCDDRRVVLMDIRNFTLQ